MKIVVAPNSFQGQHLGHAGGQGDRSRRARGLSGCRGDRDSRRGRRRWDRRGTCHRAQRNLSVGQRRRADWRSCARLIRDDRQRPDGGCRAGHLERLRPWCRAGATRPAEGVDVRFRPAAGRGEESRKRQHHHQPWHRQLGDQRRRGGDGAGSSDTGSSMPPVRELPRGGAPLLRLEKIDASSFSPAWRSR